MSSKEKARHHERATSKQWTPEPATGKLNKQPTHPAAIIQRAALDPASLTLQDVLHLQRTIGNRAAGRLLAGEDQRQPATEQETSTGLSDDLRAGVERLSGLPMDDVRVHYHSPRPAQLRALAYTQGTDIHLGPGQEKHLPHEAWHVVQQKQGRVRATLQAKGVSLNDDVSLEREADAMGSRAARGPGASRVSVKPAHAVGARGSRPIQRQLNPRSIIDGTKPKWGMDGKFRNDLLAKVTRYNKEEGRKDTSKANVHGNLARLDEIEHLVYQWFGETKADADNKNRRGMFSLLDDVQADHKFWIGRNVEAGYQPWLHGDVTQTERKQINKVWKNIVEGTGAFQFVGQVHTQSGAMRNLPPEVLTKFKTDVFAMLARLISRPNGRKLLTLLDAGHADAKTISFVMSPLYKLLGTPGYATAPYVGAKATATREQDAMLKLRGQKKKNLKLERGKGSGASVELAPGIKDSSMMDFDAKGNPILSPTFVGVGHELIHAAHYGQGTYIGLKPRGAPHATIPGEYDDDVEEFLTISSTAEQNKSKKLNVSASVLNLSGQGSRQHRFKMSDLYKLNEGVPTEADIRAEHGLSIRSGHSSTANPYLYPGATKTDEPGTHVKEGVNWITPHVSAISPPPVVAPRAVVPVRAVGNQGWALITPKIKTFLKGVGLMAVVGGLIATSLLLKYGFPASELEGTAKLNSTLT